MWSKARAQPNASSLLTSVHDAEREIPIISIIQIQTLQSQTVKGLQNTLIQ